ncbi:MAG: DUF6029 family protein [Bacteroidota bacterium]|nr:DUF6029 family protein [Bacteroidota bacterium]
MRISLYIITLLTLPIFLSAQNNNGQINGDFNLNMQFYQDDESIKADAPDETILNNSYLNIVYTKGNFTLGVRYESYLNALLGYDREYQGNDIIHRYATFNKDKLEVTTGNFYEQFGKGLTLRSYEDKGLGIDNSIDGIRVNYEPIDGFYIKSLIGKSRTYFEYSDGIIRGADAEIHVNSLLNWNLKTDIRMGGSIVSRYQKNEEIDYELPENVSVYSGRMNIQYDNWDYYIEYANKINDPEGSGNYNYAEGNAMISNLTYSKRGFSVSLEGHRSDHFEFRSVRGTGNGREYIINYLPTLGKQHTYSLLALHPPATQIEGEFGYQIDVFYKIKKGSSIGGKYGTNIDLHYSKIMGLEAGPNGEISSYLDDYQEYTPAFMGDPENLYYSDINISVERKINKQLKINTIAFSLQSYNRGVLEGDMTKYGRINSKIGVIDMTYKLNKQNAIRSELQILLAEEEEFGDTRYLEGDWSMGLIEYTINKEADWFFAIQDMYNWGNPDVEKQLHYLNIDIGYIKGANRFALGYGKKRQGIFCVGGVCRTVPASNGFSLSISSNF